MPRMKARRTVSPPSPGHAILRASVGPGGARPNGSDRAVGLSLVCLAVAAGGLVSGASVARASGPIVEDLDGATPLRTEIPPPPAVRTPGDEAAPRGGATAGATGLRPVGAPAMAEARPTADRNRQALMLHGRWVTVPDALLGAFFEAHPTYDQLSTALSFETGESDGNVWAFEAGWLPLVPAAGNWQSRLSAPSSATYLQSDLHLVTLDATYRHQFEAGEVFRGFLGGGLGLGLIVGDATTDEVLPDCVAPASACAHWPSASRKAVDLPTRVLPILHLTGGLEVDLSEALSLRVSGGFRNVLYLGLGLGLRL
jgi:hypothetical protein